MSMIILFIISSITALSYIYILTKMIDCPFKRNRLIISSIFLILGLFVIKIVTFLSIYTPIFSFVCLLISCFITFPKQPLIKSFGYCFILFILYILLDITLSILLISFHYNTSNISIPFSFIINIFINLFAIIIIRTNFMKPYIDLILKNFEKHKFVIVLISLSISTFLIIKSIPIHINTLIILLFSFICIVIFLLLYNLLKQEQLKKMDFQYQELLGLISSYEEMIEEKMRTTHEFKNQLLLIQAMIGEKDKKLKKYLEELTNTNSKIDQTLLLEIKKIPFKTFNGMLYYKITKAIQENIDIELDISKNLKKKVYLKIDQKDINDICKLTGIFMDNAIEASNNIEEKQISISIYENEKKELAIAIANKVNKIVNLKKSTKGKNHGYGLLIAQDIINSNPNINNNHEYISNVFIQNITLKIQSY